MTSPRTLVAVAACAVLLVSGCGGGEKVGSGVNTKVSPGASGGLFPSTAPPKVKPSASPKPRPRTTTAPPRVQPSKRPTTVRPTAAEPPPFVITINGDKSGKALIDPNQASVYTGYKVVWRNADTKPHGVLSQDGRINSGKCDPPKGITATCIQPGKSFTWVAGAPGTYAYKDSSRPYVNAQILVAPR